MVIGEKILTSKSCHGDKNFTLWGNLRGKSHPLRQVWWAL